MAINYTALFTDAGKPLKYLNTYVTLGKTTLPADFAAIAGVLSTSLRFDVLSGLSETYEGFQDQAINWASGISSKIVERFQNEPTVISQLPLGSRGSLNDLLRELLINMIDNTQTVEQSAVTVGTVTADAGNAGDAEVFVSKVLDGVSNPRDGYEPQAVYAGVNSELCVTSETVTVTCAQDSEGGLSEGAESWSIVGGVPGNNAFDWRSEGSGIGPAFNTANSRGMVSNGEFETFTVTNTPDDWTIVTGAVTTNILQDSVGQKRGDSCLQLKGDGATASIKISQAISNLEPLKAYLVAAWIKGDATIAGTSAFTMQFEGTGYTASSSEKISLNQAALAALTGWDLKNFWIVMPKEIPDDMVLTINASGTLTTAALIRVDGLCLVEGQWHGGVAVGVVAGGTKVLKGDRYTFTLANNNFGVFQTFARKGLKIQFPSDGTPSIADTLAT